MRWLGLSLIRFYQISFSRVLPSTCRFVPSCSEYSRQAIEKHGHDFPYAWKLEKCTGCSKCAEICPCNFIEMH